MFVCESSPSVGMAVLVLGPPPRADDWSQYLATVERLNASAPRDVRPILVQYLRGSLVPDAVSRRALGKLREKIRPDVLNVVVTSSPLVRATQVAVDWWHKPHYDSSVHADGQAALAYVEGKLGRPMPELSAMCERALLASLG